MTGNTFDNISDGHANGEEGAKYDDIGNIVNLDKLTSCEDISEYRKQYRNSRVPFIWSKTISPKYHFNQIICIQKSTFGAL